MRPAIGIFGFGLLALLPCHAWAVPMPPTMYRLQAGTLDASGWTAAASTGGNFSIRMPCLFNDFSIEDSDPASVTSITYGLGCRRPDGALFTAARIRYRNGAPVAQTYFDTARTGPGFPGAAFTATTFAGSQALDAVTRARGLCFWMRMVRDGPETIVLGVEGPAAMCEQLRPMASEFFAALDMRPAAAAAEAGR